MLLKEQNDEYDLYGVTYSDISNDVDNEFEDELNSLSFDEIGFGNELVEHLARKFGGDAAKAIRESEDTQAAVLNLAASAVFLLTSVFFLHFHALFRSVHPHF